jgi:CDP-diacylglycerol--serine O-phosphatidyltransferase
MLDLERAYFLILPVTLAGIFHMLVVKKNWFSFLKIPLSTAWFGANKTLRGFIVMPVVTGIFCVIPMSFGMLPEQYLSGVRFFHFGFVVGVAYVVFELPNSFLKRRLGIAPGESARRYRWIFFLLDRFDSALGCTLAFVFLGMTWSQAAWIIPVGMTVHFGVTGLLKFIGLKEKL